MQYTMVVPSLATDNEVETIPIATLADYRSVTPDEDFLLLDALDSTVRRQEDCVFSFVTSQAPLAGRRRRPS